MAKKITTLSALCSALFSDKAPMDELYRRYYHSQTTEQLRTMAAYEERRFIAFKLCPDVLRTIGWHLMLIREELSRRGEVAV